MGSGTFIALDRILQGIRKYDVVDIFGIVYEMRKERVWMVQTEQQYICIHQCLLAVLEGKEQDQRHLDQLHDNEAFEDDEGIAESGMRTPRSIKTFTSTAHCMYRNQGYVNLLYF